MMVFLMSSWGSARFTNVESFYQLPTQYGRTVWHEMRDEKTASQALQTTLAHYTLKETGNLPEVRSVEKLFINVGESIHTGISSG